MLYFGAVSAVLQANSAEVDSQSKEAGNAADEKEAPEALERKPVIINGVDLGRARVLGQPFIVDSLELSILGELEDCSREI